MVEIKLPLDIDSLEILSQSTDIQGNIVFEVVSKKKCSKCHKCGKAATKRHSLAPVLRIKHLPLFDTPVLLVIRPVRYECEHCDDHPTTTEQYDWCERRSTTTKGLERYVMRSLIHSTIQDVSRKTGISYDAVESAVNRQVSQEVDWSQYTNIGTIGIDEIAIKKGHSDYMTIVSVRLESGPLSVVAVLPDRTKETVLSFFLSIPKRLKSTVKSVCTDMYDGFVQAAIEVFGSSAVVIDRYHVAKLYREPIDAIRLKEMERLKVELPEAEYAKLSGAMWALRKKHECLSSDDQAALDVLYKHSPELKSAHVYALKLTNIFNTEVAILLRTDPIQGF